MGEKLVFTDVFSDVTRKATKIPAKEYQAEGINPIIDQGQNIIAGYSDVSDGLFTDVPAIVFGDHTCVVKYVDTPFLIGADGTKILRQVRNDDSRFLFHALKYHAAHLPGGKEYTRHFKWLKDCSFDIPDLDRQRQIAESFDTIQNEVAAAKQMLAKADELIQSRFVEMFEQDKQIKHVRLDHISLVGSSHRVFKSEILTSGVPFYRGSEISSLSRGDSASASLFISYEHYEELISQSGKPEIGDLLLPSICDKGQIWCVNTNDPFYFKDGRVLWIRPDKTIINSEYLKRAICSVLYKDFIKLTSGTTFAELKIFILKGIEVPLPPLALQNEFAEFVTQVESLKATTRQQLDRLNTLYDSLAQRYFAE